MKKLNRVAVLFASAALAAPIAAFAQARTVDNWRAGDGTTVWR
ncbi:MAG: OmpA family protein, partial [Pseudomonadota bacterium]